MRRLTLLAFFCQAQPIMATADQASGDRQPAAPRATPPPLLGRECAAKRSTKARLRPLALKCSPERSGGKIMSQGRRGQRRWRTAAKQRSTGDYIELLVAITGHAGRAVLVSGGLLVEAPQTGRCCGGIYRFHRTATAPERMHRGRSAGRLLSCKGCDKLLERSGSTL